MSTTATTKVCDKKRVLRIALLSSLGVVVLLVISRLNNHFRYSHEHTHPSHHSNAQESKMTEDVGKNSQEALFQLNSDIATQRDNTYGYIFVSRYSDQMTGASFNILSLQCWAASISPRVGVVKPFLRKGSRFGFSLTSPEKWGKDEDNSVELGDVFDMKSWERQTRKKGYMPLVDWKEFLQSMPRRLILINRKCVSTNSSKKCASYDNRVYRSVSTLAWKHNFTIVRYAHFELRYYTAQEFEELVYGENEPEDSVVLFNYWGGIINSAPQAYRIAISDMRTCDRRLFSGFLFRNSERIDQDSKRYLEEYMPLALEKGYISVMFRSERFALDHQFQSISSQDKKRSLFTDCVNSIGKCVDELKRHFGIRSIFLAMDCLKQGSSVFRQPDGPEYIGKDLINSIATMLHQRLYGNLSSLDEWEESFDKVASFRTPGYLAQIQKNLAAGGTCLLTAGGGSFQMSAEKLYNVSHKSHNAHCSIRVPKCW